MLEFQRVRGGQAFRCLPDGYGKEDEADEYGRDICDFDVGEVV